MILEIGIAGPGLDAKRRLEAGAAELVLGRDADCDICLPDPQRNVSRRHLAVWNVAGELHFRVLSVVNGVEMPFGEAPPGAQGVLPPGQMLKLGGYIVEVTAAPLSADPWAVFDGQPGAGFPPEPPPSLAEEDPFGDWGFESTFGPGSTTGLQLGPAGAPATDLTAFFQGMGLDPAKLASLTVGELEAAGRAVRTAVVGLLELHAARAEGARDLGAESGTVTAVQNSNPLKTDRPAEAKLRYLFGGRGASAGFISPERALQDLLGELLAHDAAIGPAVRAAVEGTVRDFSPVALKAKLLGNGSKLFEGTRAWDAYGKFYEEQDQDMAGWIQALLDRHFTHAYLRESERAKRGAGSGSS